MLDLWDVSSKQILHTFRYHEQHKVSYIRRPNTPSPISLTNTDYLYPQNRHKGKEGRFVFVNRLIPARCKSNKSNCQELQAIIITRSFGKWTHGKFCCLSELRTSLTTSENSSWMKQVNLGRSSKLKHERRKEKRMRAMTNGSRTVVICWNLR